MINDRLRRSTAGLSRPIRRLLAATSVFGYAAGMGAQEVGLRTDARDVGNALALALIVVAVTATLLVWRWSRNRARWEDDGLDERDRRERDRSWAISYRILALTVAVGVVAVSVVSLSGAQIAADLARQLLLGMIVFVAILPTLVLAWNEPDLPTEDT